MLWHPAVNDFFGIPDRGMDDEVFVISDVFANVEWLRGHLAVTFHCAAEWALDHVLLTEVVWLPSEAQLREELQRRLAEKGPAEVHLIGTQAGCACEFRVGGQQLRFESPDASGAYAAALLYMLQE